MGLLACSNSELVYKNLNFFILLVGFLLGGIGMLQGLIKYNRNIERSLTYIHAYGGIRQYAP
jgi:hypothetical protein